MWARLCRAGGVFSVRYCVIEEYSEYLDDDNTFVETYGHLIGIFAQRNTPCALESIVERVFHSVRPAVPNLDRPILASADDDWEVGVENSEGHIVGVTFHRLYTALAEIIPHFDGLVVACGNEVGLVGAGVEIDIIDALVVSFHCEIGV